MQDEITVEKLAIVLDAAMKELIENRRRWADLHKYLANSRNAAIMDLGGKEDFLGYSRSITPRREKVRE
jgi:imidazoleglycerol phosphate dehydratase HisB